MKRLLLIKLWASGDILMTTPLLTALRQSYPDLHIAWAVDTGHAEILRGQPLIDELIPIDTGRWRRFLRKGNVLAWGIESQRWYREMQVRQFDAIINCHPDQWWTRILCPSRVGVALYPSSKLPITRHLYTHSLARPVVPMHNSDYYLQTLSALGLSGPFDRHMLLPITAESQSQASAFLQNESAYRKDLPLILLHPGTSQASKCWPTDYFAEVAAALLPEHNVVITGSPRELPLASAILAVLPPDGLKPLIAIGKLPSIGATAALVQLATAAVSGDTAVLHMASALETPLVGIFGSTRPGDNQPLYGPQVLLYDNSVSCAPCYQGNCPLKGSLFMQCQRAVTPKQVLAALKQLTKEKIL